MKKILVNTILPILAIIAFVVVLGRVGYWENHYTTTATVVDIKNENILIEDETGNLWECLFDENDFVIGNTVKVTMFNGHTDLDIYDDEIEKMEKIF